ncbi:hypothetical protein [Pantoea rwandensis]|uniref:hypothetical protein n=1 Tax=Pantoea rwandensis TaxID=1076550 RepID=UPI0026C13C24
MSERKRHPHKEIESVLRYAEVQGWKIVQGGHHAWGKMYCPEIQQSVGVVMTALPASGVRQKALKITQEC